MSIKQIMAEKRAWKALQARVKAMPEDYQIVYFEMQKYLFKIGACINFAAIIELFEDGIKNGKGVLDLTGADVAAFCDALAEDDALSVSSYEAAIESSIKSVEKAVTKSVEKSLRKNGSK